MFPKTEPHFLGQPFHLPVFQNYKLLIGRRLEIKGKACLLQHLHQPPGCLNGILADAPIQPGGKQRVKLDSQQPAFCQQRAMLLDLRQKMPGRIAPRKDHRLPAQRANFGAANIKRIAASGNVRRCYIRLGLARP